MDFFNYVNNQLMAEQCSLFDIANEYGTPCYVYSKATLVRHWHAFDDAFGQYPHLICYAVKANSNLAVLQCLAKLGSGFDIVSQGELERVLIAGGDPQKIVFSGVAKQRHEIERALTVGIACFNIESVAELALLANIAKAKQIVAPISFRVNPDIDANTHPYIATGLHENKFGINIDDAMDLYEQAAKNPWLAIKGIDCHIGSQLTSLQPFLDALDRVLVLVDALTAKGIILSHIDVGGGLGVIYHNEQPPLPSEFSQAVLAKLGKRSQSIILEPGRAIAANAGILLTSVLYEKNQRDKNFLLVDAAMNDLLRPALYQAWHEVVPVKKNNEGAIKTYDIVGPVCETGDFLAKQRMLSAQAGDLLAVRGAGAYGFVMSSQYNTRPRAPEILVDGDKHYVVRCRETYADLFQHEQNCLATASI